MAATSQCRVAVARERLRGVRADVEALTGVSHHGTIPPPSRSRCGALPDTDDEVWSSLMVRVEDLKAHCAKIGSSAGVLAVADAVEFVKATNAWVYWLCPVCDKVFLDSNSLQSHVESEYIHQLQQLLPLMQPSTTMRPTSKNSSSTGVQEDGEEITRIGEIVNGSEVPFVGCVAFSILDGPEIPSVDPMSFSSLDEPEVSSVEPVSKVVKSKKGRRRKTKKWDAYFDHCREIERDCPSWEELLLPLCREMPELWEYLESCVETEESEYSSHLISLVEDGSVLFLDSQKIAPRNMDGSFNVDALFNWLLSGSSPQEPVPSWTSIRKRCVHDGNEVLKRIGEILDLLQEQFGLKDHSDETMHGDFFTTKVNSIDVEISHMSSEVSFLRKKLVKVCTFDYRIVILPLIRDYLWAKLNNDSPGKELHDTDDIHEEYVVQEKSRGTDSDLDHQSSRTEEFENSSLSFSESSDLSTLETESTSFNSGIGTVHQITTDELSLNVTLRALWHLRRFHVFRQIPHTLHHLSVRDHCVVCLLCEIFYSWDHNEDHTAAILLGNAGTAFSDILNDRNFDYKENKNIAYEIISIIVEILHMSQKHYSFETFEPVEISPSRCFGYCVPHDVLALHFKQKKCNCVNKPGGENDYIAIFHTVDVGAIQKTEMKSFGDILKAAELDVESCRCGNKPEGSLLFPPYIFTTVFSWPTEKENYVDMSEVLINIAAPLDIIHTVYEVDFKSMYRLITVKILMPGHWVGRGTLIKVVTGNRCQWPALTKEWIGLGIMARSGLLRVHQDSC
uniref:C2H2-type domain-containing protein n=1 Tax=Oryza punctata TaxID=4537 RepID=A0A0E0MGW0_ORYPU